MTLLPIDDALERRHSVRGFTDAQIPEADLATLFDAAQKAASWCNTQPWNVVVTAGEATARVRQAMLETARAGTIPTPDIPFPPSYSAPYNERRIACGVALYGAMGVARDDKKGRFDAWLRNYAFFDAPHLAVVSRDTSLGEYATLDVGVWLGVLMTMASAMGIDMCAMASTAAYPAILRRELDIPESQSLLFGIALGYEDESVPANRARTRRESYSESVRLEGF